MLQGAFAYTYTQTSYAIIWNLFYFNTLVNTCFLLPLRGSKSFNYGRLEDIKANFNIVINNINIKFHGGSLQPVLNIANDNTDILIHKSSILYWLLVIFYLKLLYKLHNKLKKNFHLAML